MPISQWLVEGSGNLSDALGFNVFLSNRKTLNYRKGNRAHTLVHLLSLSVFVLFGSIGHTDQLCP